MHSLRHVLYNNKSGRWYNKESKKILYFRPLNEDMYYFKYRNKIPSAVHLSSKNGYYYTYPMKYHIMCMKNGKGFFLYGKSFKKIGHFVPL